MRPENGDRERKQDAQSEASDGRGGGADGSRDRAATFLHELSNLVDGSLRSVRLARSELAAPHEAEVEEGISHAMRRLQAAETALAHVTKLIHAHRGPTESGAAAMRHGVFEPAHSVAEALTHAVDVLRPLADERGVRLELEIHASVGSAPPTPIYAVVTNGVRNAIEAIGSDGTVWVRACTRPEPGGRAVLVIDICDDGPGLADGVVAEAFEFGFTTKDGSSGIGLALSSDIVRQLGGEISLSNRVRNGERTGAMLRIVAPFGLGLGAQAPYPGSGIA